MERLKGQAWHKLSAEEVLKLLGVELAAGLSTDAVKRRQAEFGLNQMTTRRGTPFRVVFLHQFKGPLI